MKLILSRKGFDSGYGGIASPILPDGRLVSLPIPSSGDNFTLADLNVEGIDKARLLTDLSRGRHSLETRVHLDPDLDRVPAARLPGWRPAFGQTGNAQSHLRDMGVGQGDVFLFFGWFREVECPHGTWRYVRGAPDLHVLFGWLEIGEALPVVLERNACLARLPWIADHPHVAGQDDYADPRNTLYVARENSAFSPTAAFGGGRFERYSDSLRLTCPGCSRSNWSLPNWFMPNGRPPLTYNPRPEQWNRDGDRVRLRSAAKGQEFVLDSTDYPEAREWVASIVRNNTQENIEE